MSTRTPTLQQVIAAALDARLRSVRVGVPAVVVRYDAERQEVDAQPVVLDVYQDEAGARATERLPVVPSVPVMFPSAGGYRVTFPIVEGETLVWLTFSDASLDRWLATGGQDVDPGFDGPGHGLSDAVAVLGLHDLVNVLPDVPADRMTVGKTGGPQIHVDGGQITIGSYDPGDLEPAALGQTLKTFMDADKAWKDAHVHPAPGGTTSAPATPSPSVPEVRSSAVKVKK